jgi:hypothetical protein
VKYTLLLFGFIFLAFHSKAQCNGSQNLCNKKYNEVAFLTTHNSFNTSADGFNFPNQNLTIQEQLELGVRGFMLDVYNLNGTSTVYHAKKMLGTAPFASNLRDIKQFLDDNPNEVVTIILECSVTANEIENDFKSAELIPSLYSHQGESWPTLKEMINNNTRLVLFTDKDDAVADQSWYHYIWDHAVETHFTVHKPSDFNSKFNRGDSANELFILNHFETKSLLGTGNKKAAKEVNTNPFFMNRVLNCYRETGKFPNFITVDFVEIGDGMNVVNELNLPKQD